MPPTQDYVAQLTELTAEMREQNSLWRSLLRGIFYGVGFVVGSAIIAVIVIGFLLPIVRDIPGVAQFFSAGVGVIQATH